MELASVSFTLIPFLAFIFRDVFIRSQTDWTLCFMLHHNCVQMLCRDQHTLEQTLTVTLINKRLSNSVCQAHLPFDMQK
jgi:hypothetical protein